MMEIMRWRAKLSVLWIFLAVGLAAGMFLSFMEPGVIENLISGKHDGTQIGEGFILLFTLLWFIPLIMAFLSLALKNSVNRWINLILGIIFAIFYIIDFIDNLTEVTLPAIGSMLMFILLIVAATLIAWYARKLPKQEA